MKFKLNNYWPSFGLAIGVNLPRSESEIVLVCWGLHFNWGSE